jgi:hypothetical protein
MSKLKVGEGTRARFSRLAKSNATRLSALREQSLAGMRDRWQEAVADDSEGLDPDAVFDRLEKKYEKMPEPAKR